MNRLYTAIWRTVMIKFKLINKTRSIQNNRFFLFLLLIIIVALDWLIEGQNKGIIVNKRLKQKRFLLPMQVSDYFLTCFNYLFFMKNKDSNYTALIQNLINF